MIGLQIQQKPDLSVAGDLKREHLKRLIRSTVDDKQAAIKRNLTVNKFYGLVRQTFWPGKPCESWCHLLEYAEARMKRVGMTNEHFNH